jgi:hypothetical protein
MNKKMSSVIVVHWLLYLLVFLLLSGIVAGSYFMYTKLSSYVAVVDHKKIDSELNEEAILNAQRLSRALEKNKDNIARASQVVADTKYYEYQDQIVRDITSYASAAGLTVLGFNFTASSSTTSKTTSKNSGAAPGVKTVFASISLKSPVPYDNYLRFLKLIERNLTKMQVTQLDISSELKTLGQISSPSITIEVYVR